MNFVPPTSLAAEADALIARYPQKRSAALMVLHLMQERFGCITGEAMEWAAQRLEVQPIQILELVTFYPMFRQKPVGRFHFKVCRTLSCALQGSHEIRAFLCEKLGLNPQTTGEQTTPDGKFTVEFVECLAHCNMAPAMMCNDQSHERLTRAKVEQILEQCRS
jgi:NADH-quinone oxidoreductase subunit E